MNLKNKRIVIDIDGTICEEGPSSERIFAAPKPDAVKSIKKLHSEGNFIILYTARCWSEYRITKSWMDEHDVPYDILLCGKPIYDLWIDDRAMKFNSWKDIVK